MRNYSTNYEDYQEYILSYKIENKEIIIKLATNELYVIPYTKENERIVIAMMERQAKNIKEVPIEIIRRNIAFVGASLSLSLIAFMKYIAVGNFITLFAIIMFGSLTILSTSTAIQNIIRNKDIKKFRYFLKNKKELNINAKKTKNLNISKKAEREIQKQNNITPININNIDSYSLKDLKKIRENIEQIIDGEIKEENVKVLELEKSSK